MAETFKQSGTAAGEKSFLEPLTGHELGGQSTSAVVAKLETGYQESGQLARQIEEISGKIQAAKHEIHRIETEEIPRATAENAQIWQLKIQALRDSITEDLRVLDRSKRDMRQLSDTAKAYMGEREISQSRIDAVWNYVQDERRMQEVVESYRDHAKGSARNFVNHWALEARDSSQVVHSFEEGARHLRGMPRGIFNNARIYNEYVTKFKEELEDLLEKGRGWKEVKLQADQIDKIRNCALRFDYSNKKNPEQNKSVLIYNGAQGVDLTEIPEERIIATFSPQERKIVDESIINKEDRASLEQRLRKSEYRVDVHGAIHSQALAENEDYNKRALANKLPELERMLASAVGEAEIQQTRLKKLQQTASLFEDAYKILDQLLVNSRHLSGSELNLQAAQRSLDELKEQRAQLPKKLFSKKPKDQQRDQELEQEINQQAGYQSDLTSQADEYRQSISQAEQELAERSTRLQELRPGIEKKLAEIRSIESASDRENLFYTTLSGLDSDMVSVRQSVEAVAAQVKRLEQVKDIWKSGRDLDVSVDEMIDRQK